MIHFVFLFIMTAMGSIAAIFLKKASGCQGIKQLLLSKDIYIGGSLYFVAALLNIYILKFLQYSVVLPLTSFTYVWTLFISQAKLHENISWKKALGVLFVVIGAFFVAR